MTLYDQFGREIEEGDLVIPMAPVLDVFQILKIETVSIPKPGQPPLVTLVLKTERQMQLVASAPRIVSPLVFIARPPKQEPAVQLQ